MKEDKAEIRLALTTGYIVFNYRCTFQVIYVKVWAVGRGTAVELDLRRSLTTQEVARIHPTWRRQGCKDLISSLQSQGKTVFLLSAIT